jgi:hypothetical protein
MNPSTARRMWTAFEPYHALIYFAPEARDAFKAIGLRGYWMGYFASRAAPLGPVPAPVVTAAFYNFAPRVVERAIPDAWTFASPDQIIATRLGAADCALRRLLGDDTDSPSVAAAAALAREAVEGCSVHGRPLFAAYTVLPWPEPPYLTLWHAATLLREHRGDGHVVALLSAGVDECEAHHTLVAGGKVPREIVQPNRGWTASWPVAGWTMPATSPR